jgi:hypothetical protein
VYLGYDSLGRLTGRWVCNGPAAMYCSGGAQVYGTDGPWRGSRMLYQSDTVLNQQVTFGYDEFNRLNARTVTQCTQQNYTYSYDRYGNRAEFTRQEAVRESSFSKGTSPRFVCGKVLLLFAG